MLTPASQGTVASAASLAPRGPSSACKYGSGVDAEGLVPAAEALHSAADGMDSSSSAQHLLCETMNMHSSAPLCGSSAMEWQQADLKRGGSDVHVRYVTNKIARIDQEASVIAAPPGAVEADFPVGAHVALPDGVGDALAMPGTATGTAPTVASLTPASSAVSISDVVSPVRLVISLDLDVASKMQIHAICNLTTCMFFNRSSAVLLCGGHYSVRSCVVLYEVRNDILNTPL